MNTYEVSFPSQKLSPNARGHWGKKSGPVASYRNESAWRAKAAKIIPPDTGSIAIHMDVYPPNRRRDKDNIEASMKAALDGLADALGVNDKRFIATYTHHEPEKPGRVVINVQLPAVVDIPIVGVIS